MKSDSNKICLVCGSTYEVSGLKGLLKCSRCGFVTADLNLEDYDFKKIYGTDYFHGNEYINYVFEKKITQKNLRSRLNLLLTYVENSREKNMFEIGAAYGYFLELAASCFSTVAGVDISEDAVKYCREHFGYNIVSGDFLDYKMDADYDVFCLWDTIEHISKPDKVIEKISSHINPHGLLAITTADIDSVNAKLRGNNWRQIHPPTHLHYFSAKTLTLLLQKHGFKILHIEYPGYYRSIDLLLYKIMSTRLHKIYELIKHTGVQNLDFYLNLHDIICVIAQKS
ncbi:MAG: methyltransferase domain-containing protein [Nitrospirae bacterium]|nr:methyltransferase domain-containing protein [Nitrospirota bacterium]